MSKDAEVSHRSALWLSMALTVLGSCGACNGMNNYAQIPVPSEAGAPLDAQPGAAEASAFVVTLAQAFIDAPNRRPLALANVVCSMMLVVGGFMLGIRRQSALWFIRNALVANMLWVAADSSITAIQIEGWRGVLVRRLIPWIHAITPPGPGNAPRVEHQTAEGLITSFVAVAVFGGLVKLFIHGFVYRRTRSPAVADFMSGARED